MKPVEVWKQRCGSLATVLMAVALALVLTQCASDDKDPSDAAAPVEASESPTTDAPTTSTTEATTTTTTEAAATVVNLPVNASWSPVETDFGHLKDMTPVRGFFVDNLLGYDEETLEVAESTTGGIWPVGSLVQLFPGEAMVKRQPGFNPASGDWEFFELDVSESGSKIRVRGGDNVVNRFGGQCSLCHSAAGNQWDHICEQDHGCVPLPIERSVIETLQDTDPRPRAQLFES